MRPWILVPVVAVVLALTACTPGPDERPEPLPSETSEAPIESSDAPAITLPDCDNIYSPAMVAALESEGRTNEGDVSVPGGGGWGTADGEIEAILAAIPDSVHCSWILPASESGSTTSIAVLDDTSRTALIAAFASGGFIASTAPGGDLYSITVEEEFITYTESHLLTADVWIGSEYAFGDASTLTLDAAAQLLP